MKFPVGTEGYFPCRRSGYTAPTPITKVMDLYNVIDRQTVQNDELSHTAQINRPVMSVCFRRAQKDKTVQTATATASNALTLQ